jgi:hypothetical protein
VAAAATAARAASARAASRQTSTMVPPNRASATDAASPIPELAPVTTQVCPAIGGAGMASGAGTDALPVPGSAAVPGPGTVPGRWSA